MAASVQHSIAFCEHFLTGKTQTHAQSVLGSGGVPSAGDFLRWEDAEALERCSGFIAMLGDYVSCLKALHMHNTQKFIAKSEKEKLEEARRLAEVARAKAHERANTIPGILPEEEPEQHGEPEGSPEPPVHTFEESFLPDDAPELQEIAHAQNHTPAQAPPVGPPPKPPQGPPPGAVSESVPSFRRKRA